jgi:hypothetical protein
LNGSLKGVWNSVVEIEGQRVQFIYTFLFVLVEYRENW